MAEPRRRQASRHRPPCNDLEGFYRLLFADALATRFGQFLGRATKERDWELSAHPLAALGIQIPDALITNCVWLCCSLCLLENDPSVISPDVLANDRTKSEATGAAKYVGKAHRCG